MNEFDHRILALPKQHRERPEKFRPEWGLEPDLCHASALLHQVSYQVNWVQVVMWVNKPVDVEIDDDNAEVRVQIPVQAWTFHAFPAAS